MPPIAHQHENERILYRTRRSHGALFFALWRSLWQGGLVGGVLAAAVGGVLLLSVGEVSPLLLAIVVTVPLILLTLRRFVIWRSTVFTITSHRILYYHYLSLLKATTDAVRWDRYQDSSSEIGPVEGLLNTGTLTIHYGTADGEQTLAIKGLPWSRDLKHYLDKIQSLRCAKTADANLPQFVRAKKGRRDKAILSYIE